MFVKEKPKHVPMMSVELKKPATKKQIYAQEVISRHMRNRAYLVSLLRRVKAKRPDNPFVKSVYSLYIKKPFRLSRKQVAVLEEIDTQVKTTFRYETYEETK